MYQVLCQVCRQRMATSSGAVCAECLAIETNNSGGESEVELSVPIRQVQQTAESVA